MKLLFRIFAMIRHDWTLEELDELYHLPLFSLLAKAMKVHEMHHDYGKIQCCKLISVKTGGCLEDCKYCAQSAHYSTTIKAEKILSFEKVIELAKQAIQEGATRICLGCAQREVKANRSFEEILKMVRAISALGAEVCVTLGMVNKEQLERLREAGLFAYNHNIDTSRRYYPKVISTRTFQERIDTLDLIQECEIHLCCGGILGLGETVFDRLEMLLELCNRTIHPQSVPINRLFPVKGTPLGQQPKTETWEVVRIIAIARITMPQSVIRLSAGRDDWSFEQHALCFMAGANSIFLGPKYLTVDNAPIDKDEEMLRIFGVCKRS